MKKTNSLFLILFLFSVQIISQVNYNSPESAVFDVQNNRYLISNTGNGNIIARAQNGTLSYFNQGGSTSIRGITIFSNRLYAAGDEGILVYDLANGQKVATYNITGKVFPNDIVADAAGNIYVSDDPAHKIYKWNATTQTVSTFVTMTVSDNPNGLFYDQANNRLIVVFWTNNSPIKAVDLTSGTVSTITTTSLSNLDGITGDNLGNYFISAWTQNAVYKFNNTFTTGPELVSGGYNGPADIFYDIANNVLVIPDMGNNTVVFMQMSTVTVTKPNGGEIWNIGYLQNIQWTSTNVAEVKIEYSTNNGTTWTEVVNRMSSLGGTYQWTIPNTPSLNCLVRISSYADANVKDQSDNIFRIQVPVSVEEHSTIYSFKLKQNYPNPFNPETTIEYSIPTSLNSSKGGTLVTLKIYDVLGREITTLVDEEKSPGNYEVKFSAKGGFDSGRNGASLQSGIYLYRLQAGSFTKTKKLILLK